jgi:hypothetical protein
MILAVTQSFTQSGGIKRMRKQLIVATILAAIGLTSTAQADDASVAASGQSAGLGLSLGAKLSTLGYGFEVGYRINSMLGVRAGINRGNYDYNETDAGTDYSYKLDFDTIPVMLDWHVFGGGFRITGGVVRNNNDLTGTATGLVDVGTGTYLTTVTSDIDFDQTSYYVGLGWSSLPSTSSGLGFSVDIGVLGHGSPTVSLTAPGVPAGDIAAEEASLNADLEDFKYWPVISVGIGYTF